MEFQTLDFLIKYGKEFGHKSIRQTGMNDTAFFICSFVHSHPACSQDDVVQALRMDKTTVAKAAMHLEEKGFLQRKANPADTRKKMLRLTTAGEAHIQNVVALHDHWLDDILGVLPSDERIAFEQTCHRLLQAAEQKNQANER